MKSNRMFGILCFLLERDRVTAKELAEYFEVSVRTIHRDLLDLSSVGFPVISQQGIGGGVSLLPNFRYSKSALNKEEMSMIFAGLNSFSVIDDSTKIKTLLAKLRLNDESKMLLENDVIIHFTSWNFNSPMIDRIKIIRKSIAAKTKIEMQYYGGKGHISVLVEPYKLVFKNSNWYLFGYCNNVNDFRLYKLNRIVDVVLSDISFTERTDYEIPELKSDFVNNSGCEVTVRMDTSFEFMAIDFFGMDNLRRDTQGNIFITFQTENTEWVLRVFAEFGDKAEILSPKSLRDEMRDFLTKAKKLYET